MIKRALVIALALWMVAFLDSTFGNGTIGSGVKVVVADVTGKRAR